MCFTGDIELSYCTELSRYYNDEIVVFAFALSSAPLSKGESSPDKLLDAK